MPFPMNYRSYADLANLVHASMPRLPRDVDLVVGIPRSGLLPAGMIALALNRPLADLDGFLAGRTLANGVTRPVPGAGQRRFRHALVVDDSIRSGGTLGQVRAAIAAMGGGLADKVTYLAVYGATPGPHPDGADMQLEVCPTPRVFQWNVMHHVVLESACLDIDGVLCRDPTPAENDDGPRYREFLLGAEPLHLPTRPVRRLVTSRLERYRPETVEWLARHGVSYGRLDMLDLPDAATRRRLGSHASFKAAVYAGDSGAKLFIESCRRQAPEVARLSGKPVLCVETNSLVNGTWAGKARHAALSPGTVARVVQGAVRRAGAAFLGLGRRP